MRELQLALDSSTASAARIGTAVAAFPLHRGIVLWSIVAHVAFLYVASRWSLDTTVPLPRPPLPEFVWLGEIVPRPAREPTVTPSPAPLPEPVVVAPRPVPESAPAEERAFEERASEIPEAQEVQPPADLQLAPGLRDEIGEPVTTMDLADRRRRAAADVVDARAREGEYLTFSLDDVAPPRVAAEAPARTIFDGTGAPIGPKVGQVGQARTKLGRRMSEICNALTGGFSLMGFGSFCAPASDGGHSGLFLEVLPAYLDALPECVETRPLDEQLGEDTPFPTVKCRLVRPPDAPPLAVRELD